MQEIINQIVKFVLRLLPEKNKTFLAAFLLALVAFNKALAEGGIVFLPDNIANIVVLVAGALMGIGLRHAIDKSKLALFMVFGLSALMLTGCTLTVKDERQPSGKRGCNCSYYCDCGPDGACTCKPGNKCSLFCLCRNGQPQLPKQPIGENDE